MRTENLIYEQPANPLPGSVSSVRYRVHVRASGERWPLCLAENGEVDVGLCMYMAAVVRRTMSVNTRLQQLRGAAAFTGYARHRGIALEERFRSGAFLDVHELFGFDIHLAASTKAGTQTRVRRHYEAMAYARFLSGRHRAWLAEDFQVRERHAAATEEFLQDFASVIRRCGPRAESVGRQGLDEAGRAALAGFLGDPSAAGALWRDRFVRRRNLLLLMCFALLGHRIGEMLSLQLRDLDLDRSLYRIVRRPDLALDPRALQPLVKGRSRELVWPAELIGPIRSYLDDLEARWPSSADGFLFVTVDGRPMSRSLVNKVFAELREHLPALGRGFCPHVLRHTWNDLFSETADQAGLSPERELRARMLAMGWSSRSTAATYTRRSDARAVEQVSDALQEVLFGTAGRAA